MRRSGLFKVISFTIFSYFALLSLNYYLGYKAIVRGGI